MVTRLKPFRRPILDRFSALFFLLSITFDAYDFFYFIFFFFSPQVGPHNSDSPSLALNSLTILTHASLLICPIHEFRGRPAVFFPPIITLYYYEAYLLRVCLTILQHLALHASVNVRFSFTVLSNSSFVLLSVRLVLYIRRQYHISKAFSFIFSIPFMTRPVSLPYMLRHSIHTFIMSFFLKLYLFFKWTD